MLREYYSASVVRETRFDIQSRFHICILREARSRGEMYIGHGRLCVCLSVPRRIPTLLHGPGCNSGNGRDALVVHYWADLQSVHGIHCYDNIAPNAKCQRVLACTPSMPGFLLLSSHIE